MNTSAFPEVDKCVSDWTGCVTTLAEVIYALHSLPTLEAQIELFSRLPDFLDEAKESVAQLPENSEDWQPGAHIPSSLSDLGSQSEKIAGRGQILTVSQCQ